MTYDPTDWRAQRTYAVTDPERALHRRDGRLCAVDLMEWPCAFRRLLDDADSMTQLMSLQHSRYGPATKAWQAAHPGNDLTWPDLGALLEWLMEGHALVREWRDAALADDPAPLGTLTTKSTDYLGPIPDEPA